MKTLIIFLMMTSVCFAFNCDCKGLSKNRINDINERIEALNNRIERFEKDELTGSEDIRIEWFSTSVSRRWGLYAARLAQRDYYLKILRKDELTKKYCIEWEE